MKKYKARCKEKNELAAAANGHSHIYTEANCLISGDTAIFSRQGKEIWRCSGIYARAVGAIPRHGRQTMKYLGCLILAMGAALAGCSKSDDAQQFVPKQEMQYKK